MLTVSFCQTARKNRLQFDYQHLCMLIAKTRSERAQVKTGDWFAVSVMWRVKRSTTTHTRTL
jgi:hypothetical protein